MFLWSIWLFGVFVTAEFRHVFQDGNDTQECGSQNLPCATISYATLHSEYSQSDFSGIALFPGEHVVNDGILDFSDYAGNTMEAIPWFTIISLDGPETTSITGSFGFRFVENYADIIGVTIENIVSTVEVIQAVNTTLNLVNCVFKRNSFTVLYLEENSFAYIANTTFEGNGFNIESKWHELGKVYYGCITSLDSSILLNSTSFIENRGITGGAITFKGGNFQAYNSQFISNKAFLTYETSKLLRERGGAIVIDIATFVIEDCTFKNNNALGAGALMIRNSTGYLESSIFDGNIAKEYGGAIIIQNSTGIELGDIECTNNFAGMYGGGLMIQNVGGIGIYYSIFQGNVGTNGGGAIFCEEVNDVEIIECSFWSNTVSDIPYASSTSSGGAIFSQDSDLFIENSLFSANNAYKGGNIAWIVEVLASTLCIENCTFEGGGQECSEGCGIYAVLEGPSNVEIINTNFSHLNASYGAAITFLQRTTWWLILIHGCNFNENFARVETSAISMLNNLVEPMYGRIYAFNISDTVFDSNSGGMAFRIDAANPVFNNTLFVNNSGGHSGGALSIFGSNTVIINSEIINNRVNEDSECGRIYFLEGHLNIRNTVIKSNYGGMYGGAICFAGGVYTESSLTIENSEISYNSVNESSGLGGGIFAGRLGNACVSLNGVTIMENYAYKGGAAYFDKYSLMMVNSKIIGNTAGNCSVRNGGGIYFEHATCDMLNISEDSNIIRDNSGDSVLFETSVDCVVCKACTFEDTLCPLPQVEHLNFENRITDTILTTISLPTHLTEAYSFPVPTNTLEIRIKIIYGRNATVAMEICGWQGTFCWRDSRSWEEGCCLCISKGNTECVIENQNSDLHGFTVWANSESEGDAIVSFTAERGLPSSTKVIISVISAAAAFIGILLLMLFCFRPKQLNVILAKQLSEVEHFASRMEAELFKAVYREKLVIVKVFKFAFPKDSHALLNVLKKRHSHIMQIYGLCNDASQNDVIRQKATQDEAIVLQYFEKGDVESYLATHYHDEFSDSQMIGWMTDMAVGLQEMHECGVVHRDVFCRNFFWGSDLVPYLGDYDLCRILRSSQNDDDEKRYQMTSANCRTPLIISPEFLEDGMYIAKGDILQLGFCLHELVYLVKRGDTEAINRWSKRYQDSLDTGNIFRFHFDDNLVPRELQSIIEACISCDVDLRISIDEVINRLKRLKSQIDTAEEIHKQTHGGNDNMAGAEMEQKHASEHVEDGIALDMLKPTLVPGTSRLVALERLLSQDHKEFEEHISPVELPSASSMQISSQIYVGEDTSQPLLQVEHKSDDETSPVRENGMRLYLD